jgi:hypothetical protein
MLATFLVKILMDVGYGLIRLFQGKIFAKVSFFQNRRGAETTERRNISVHYSKGLKS